MTHPFSRVDVPRGAERELSDVSRALAQRGHDVHVVTGSRSGIRRHHCGALVEHAIPLPLPAVARRRGWTDETAFAVVAMGAATTSRADIVHCLHYADAWGVLRGRRLRRRPVVLKLTGMVLPERLDQVRVNRRMFREAVADADEVWCNSDYARREMAAFGRPMHVVPAPVDLSRFRPTRQKADRPLVVCTAAPLEPRKRLTDVLDGWRLVRATQPDAQLVLAGAVTEPVRRSLSERLAPADRDSVQFTGALPDDELVDLLSRAHVAVAPAVFEALGLATLEALACGTAVAGARSGATAELLHGACGETFEPADPQSCGHTILGLLATDHDDAAVRARRAAVAGYDLPLVAEHIERRYTALRSAR